jgi:hypothetical protein
LPDRNAGGGSPTAPAHGNGHQVREDATVPGRSETSKRVPGVAHVTDPEARLRKARSCIRWVRDCGAAGIVGGATVALTLMLGGGAVPQDVFVALEVIWGLILLAGTLFSLRAALVLGGRVPTSVLVNELLPAVLIIQVGIMSGFRGRWPIEPHAGEWWEFIALGLVVCISGAIRRHRAEAVLERMTSG